MIIYNPENVEIVRGREKEAERILDNLPYKYAFISGSFLFKKKYRDIDVFVITRSKKKVKLIDKKINITKIDFNDLYSLFYHSISKSCIAKNLLSKKSLKVTVADYWKIINEAIPTILNQKRRFHKDIRYLVLYTEYFKNKKILSTNELGKKIIQFKNYKEVLEYVKNEAPEAIKKRIHKGYLKRYFYTQSGFYKDSAYESQKYLYALTHRIIKVAI